LELRTIEQIVKCCRVTKESKQLRDEWNMSKDSIWPARRVETQGIAIGALHKISKISCVTNAQIFAAMIFNWTGCQQCQHLSPD
jgi:hypothetical protein